jgi:hypothetical protein
MLIPAMGNSDNVQPLDEKCSDERSLRECSTKLIASPTPTAVSAVPSPQLLPKEQQKTETEEFSDGFGIKEQPIDEKHSNEHSSQDCSTKAIAPPISAAIPSVLPLQLLVISNAPTTYPSVVRLSDTKMGNVASLKGKGAVSATVTSHVIVLSTSNLHI